MLHIMNLLPSVALITYAHWGADQDFVSSENEDDNKITTRTDRENDKHYDYRWLTSNQ